MTTKKPKAKPARSEAKSKNGKKLGRPRKTPVVEQAAVPEPTSPDQDGMAELYASLTKLKEKKEDKGPSPTQLDLQVQADNEAKQAKLLQEMLAQQEQLARTAQKIAEKDPESALAEKALLMDFVCGGPGQLEVKDLKTSWIVNRSQMLLELAIGGRVLAVRVSESLATPVFLVAEGDSERERAVLKKLVDFARLFLKAYMNVSVYTLVDVTTGIG